MDAHINRNILWRSLEGVTLIGTALLQYAVLTRYVTVSTVGVFSLVIAWSYVLASLSFNMGIKMIVTRDISQGDNPQLILSNAVVLQSLLSFGMLAIFIPTLYAFGYFDDIRTGLIIVSAVDLALFPIVIFQSLIQAREEMYKMAIINCTSYTISVLLEIIVLIYHFNFVWIYWAVASQLLLQALLTLVLLRGETLFQITLVRIKVIWELLRQVFPVVLLGIVTMLYIRTDVFMIDYYIGKRAVGYYTAAYTFLDYLMLISHFMMSAIFPNFSKYIKDDTEKYKKLYRSILLIFLKYLYPVAFLLFIFPKLTIGFFYAEEYTVASTCLQIHMLAALLAWLNGPSGTILIGYKKQHIYLYATALSLLVNIGLNYFFIPAYGIIGAAIATLCTEFVLVCYCLYAIKKLSGYVPFLTSREP